MSIPKDVTNALNGMFVFAATHPAFSVAGLNTIDQYIAAQDADIQRLKTIGSEIQVNYAEMQQELADSRQAHVLRAETYEVLRSTNATMVAKLREFDQKCDGDMCRDQKMAFEKWWDKQVHAGKQPDDHACMLAAKAGWSGSDTRMRFAGYIEKRYISSPADVGSICKVNGGRYTIPAFTADD